jgi:type IV pilus assembly protein PilB
MGIEPYLIASTVNTIIGQRLVRRVAENKSSYQADKTEIQAINDNVGRLLPQKSADVSSVSQQLGYKSLPVMTQNAYTLYRGKDTSLTPGGYKGRVGLYEVIDVNDVIESMILNRATANEIQSKAVEQGTVTMREDGYLKAISGITTLEEVNRVTATDNA